MDSKLERSTNRVLDNTATTPQATHYEQYSISVIKV